VFRPLDYFNFNLDSIYSLSFSNRRTFARAVRSDDEVADERFEFFLTSRHAYGTKTSTSLRLMLHIRPERVASIYNKRWKRRNERVNTGLYYILIIRLQLTVSFYNLNHFYFQHGDASCYVYPSKSRIRYDQTD